MAAEEALITCPLCGQTAGIEYAQAVTPGEPVLMVPGAAGDDVRQGAFCSAGCHETRPDEFFAAVEGALARGENPLAE